MPRGFSGWTRRSRSDAAEIARDEAQGRKCAPDRAVVCRYYSSAQAHMNRQFYAETSTCGIDRILMSCSAVRL